MRSWLSSALITMGLIAGGCANSPTPQKTVFDPSNGNGGQDTGATSGVDTSTNGEPGNTIPDAGNPMGDAGSLSDSGIDAGPQCIVPVDAPRGFHCDYINRIATGLLAPPDSGLDAIKGCKDFPTDVSEADVETTCNALFPIVMGSVVVGAGACDTTDAQGYCSDNQGGRDFAYHADCDVTNQAGGSGSWACEKFVPGATGWTCLTDEAQSWGGDGCGGDGGADGGEPDAALPGECSDIPSDGDGKVYRCNYVNSFASAATSDKHDVLGCKEYHGTWNQADAESDCKNLTQADKTKPRTLAQAECAKDGADGYCPNTRGDLEYAYEGGCKGNNSGAWACANVTSCAKDWVCLGEPARSCVDASPAAGDPACTNLPFNTSAAGATTLCVGTTATLGECDQTGAVGTCKLGDGSEQIFKAGICADLRTACKGEFECLVDEPVYSCHKKDTGSGCSLGILCATPTWCVDYAQADGWTEAAAAANCTADKVNPNNTSKANVESTPKNTSAESCQATRPEKTRCVVKVDGKDTRRYGEPSCSGTSEEVPQTTCTNTGIITCRYSSTFTADNCADFQTTECWTEEQVKAHCTAQTGATANTVVVVKNDTCLAKTPTADRCKAEAAGKTWYAYGAPAAICTGSIGGTNEKAPHQPY